MKTAESEIRKDKRELGILGIVCLVSLIVCLLLTFMSLIQFWGGLAIIVASFVGFAYFVGGFLADGDALRFIKKEREGKLS